MSVPKDCPNHESCAAIEQDRRHWHLDRSFSIGHILTTLVALCSFIYWAMKQESRLTALEQHDIQLAEADKSVRAEMAIGNSHISKRLDRIEDKLDRVLGGRRGQ